MNAISLAGGGAVAQACFLTIEALIARHLGEAAYGAYGTVFAIALAMTMLADCGMGWKLIEDGSRDSDRISPLLGTTLVLKLLACALLYPAALLFLPAVGYDPLIIGFFAVFFGYSVMVLVQDTLSSVYAARQQMYVNALFQGATPAVLLGAVTVAVWYSPTLRAVGLAYVAGAAAVTGVWLWLTFKREHPRIDLGRSRRILAGSYHYGLTAILYQASTRLDLILLSLWRDLSEAGLFVAGDKLVDVGLKVGIMLSRVLAPALFKQSEHEPEAYRRSCKILLRGFSAMGALGCLVLAVIAEPLLVTVFGAPFAAAVAVLSLLSLSLFARLIAVALYNILSSSGAHARRTGSIATALAVAAAGNVLLIPRYGIAGAAVARAATDFVHVAALLGARKLPISSRAASVWILGPLALAFVGYLTSLWLELHPLVELVIAVGTYCFGLIATRMLRIAELREVLRAALATVRR